MEYQFKRRSHVSIIVTRSDALRMPDGQELFVALTSGAGAVPHRPAEHSGSRQVRADAL